MAKKYKKRNFFQRFWDAFWRPEMLVLPGQVAFFLFLSLVPTITLIGYACSYINVSNELIFNLITKALGREFSEILTPILTSTEITPAFFITLGVGYFIASNGMASIIVASNTIYGIRDSGFFRRRLKALIMELIIVILLLFVLLVPLFGDSIINLLHYINLDTSSTELIIKILHLFQGPISWLIIFLFIKIIYTMAPDKKVPSSSVNGGAIFTTLLWIGITALYSYYINNYANYSIFYGSLANIVVLMIWVYFLSFVFVIGMAMNYREEQEKTGIIEVQKVINESANSAPVMEDEKTAKIPDLTKEIPVDKIKEELSKDKKSKKKKKEEN
jgi:membrane protein